MDAVKTESPAGEVPQAPAQQKPAAEAAKPAAEPTKPAAEPAKAPSGEPAKAKDVPN
jgi:hypothetical protein